MPSPSLRRRYGGPHGYGHTPDPADHMRTNVRTFFARAGIDQTTTPPAASNRNHGPGVFNQGPTSSCTGHAVSGAIFGTLSRAGTPQSAPCSPAGIYTIGRCIDRYTLPDGTRPAIVDQGTMPNQVTRGLSEYGAPPMRERPADGRYSDADPATINDEPDLTELEQASDLELSGDYVTGTWDRHFVNIVRASIAAGINVCFAIFCDTTGPRSVEQWEPQTGPLSAVVTPNDPGGGRHYVYADGYRTLPNGKTIVEWVNSWGIGWGLVGYGEGDEAFMSGWGDVVIMSVKRKVFAAA